MFNLTFYNKVTRRFGYRKAWPNKIIMEFSAQNSNCPKWKTDLYRDVHQELAEAAAEAGFKGGPDNHDGYELTHEKSGSKMYIFFSDWKIYCCLGYQE